MTRPAAGPPADGRPDPPRWRAAGLVVLVLSAIAVTAALTLGRSSIPPGARTKAVDWALPNLKGAGLVELTSFRGRPVVVNFYASWCAACDSELPNFRRVSQEFRGQVQFIGVDALDSGDPLLMPRRHRIMWWPLARDQGGRDHSGLHDVLGGAAGIPMTGFYDGAGQLVVVERGALTASLLRAHVEELLAGTLRPWRGRQPLRPLDSSESRSR